MTIKKIIPISIIVFSLHSCQKKDETVPTPASVAISITSPVTGQLYHSGDTIFINADVSYQSELHGYELKIVDTATGDILYDTEQHVHSDHFTVNDKWVYTGTQTLGLKLSLVTAIDHNGANAEKDINFKYQP